MLSDTGYLGIEALMLNGTGYLGIESVWKH